MRLCLMSDRRSFDLRQGTVSEGWNGLLRAQRDQPAARTTKCTRCSIRTLCGMCPANGELEAGDPETPVDFLCQVGHLRAKAFGIPVPEHGDCEYCEGQ